MLISKLHASKARERRIGQRSSSVCATTLLLTLVLASCASHTERRVDDAAARNFAAKGYVSTEHDAVTTAHCAWSFEGHDVDVVVSVPRRSGRLPVVIYLPGLGETSDAGALWRSTWSAAGYAVISVQALTDDARAWSSELARDGDFKLLGRQRFAGAAMNERVQVLADVLAEARRRDAAGESPWHGLDWERIAIAGFDLGAYSAMAIAGEHVPDAERAAGLMTVRAAIALSPFASSAGGSVDTRYRDIHAPVLSVTSDNDDDVLGLVDGAHLRDMPFTHLAGSGTYLLTLQGVRHADFGGNTGAKGSKPDSDQAKRSTDGDSRSGGDSSSQRRKGGGRADSAGSGTPDRARPNGIEGGGGSGLSATNRELHLVAAREVSTAFLDAYLKDDPRARAWLASSATTWLGSTGELRRK